MTDVDEHWMTLALAQCDQAERAGEVPVGAVLVKDDHLLAVGWNQVVGSSDPTAHAEVVALRSAAAQCGNYRLMGATLYVTLEPCTMCVGAMIHARIERLVFATREPRAGAVCSTAHLLDVDHYNHRVKWREGIMARASSDRLRRFFQARRGVTS